MLSNKASKTASGPPHGLSHGPAAVVVGEPDPQTFRLGFVGALTIANSQDFENELVAALQRYRHLELDLAGVSEIDHYGIHLLVLLNRVADREVVIASSSPAVDSATRRLFIPSFAAKAKS